MRAGAQDRSGLLASESEGAQELGEVGCTSAAARPSWKRWSSVAGSLVALGLVLCLLRAHAPGAEHAPKETAFSNAASLANASGAAQMEAQQATAQLAEPVHNETILKQSVASAPPPASDPQAGPNATSSNGSFLDTLAAAASSTGESILGFVQAKSWELLAAVGNFFQSLFASAWQSVLGWVQGSVPFLAPTCSGIEPTSHYPLPGKDYTQGLPSPLVAHPSGMTMCDVERLQQDCVEQINVFRAGAPFSDGRHRDHGHLDPLQLAPEDFRKCMNEKASSDQLYSVHKGAGCGHWSFGLSCEQDRWVSGENSCCPRSCGSYDDCRQTLIGCLQQMWDEGKIVLDTGNTEWGTSTGHYWNMLGNAKYAACGFGFDSDGGMLATQNFF